MTNEKLYEIFGDISDKYIREAREYRKPSRSGWRQWGAVAACLCIVLAGALLLQPGGAGDTPQIISRYKGASGGKYPLPVPGEYFCVAEVNAAREHYAGKNVRYLLSLAMFKAGGERLSDEEERAEYQRLAELGYELYEIENWHYQGKLEKYFFPVVVGLFSEEDLADFQLNPAYGYTFYFEVNGDGKPVSIEGCDAITDFYSHIKG